MDSVVGTYVCSRYIGKPSENNFHHVTISRPKDSSPLSFQWTNRAGRSWSLSCQSPDDEFLQVGSECLYYSKGYKQCKVVKDKDGKVIALVGPSNEQYDKSDEAATINDEKEKVPVKKNQEVRKDPTPAKERPKAKMKVHQNKKTPTPPRSLTIPTWDDDDGNNKEDTCSSNNGTPGQPRHAFIVGSSSTGARWKDLVVLAAIPASATRNQGRPTILVPGDVSDQDDDAFVDFLTRYKPTDVSVFVSEDDKFKILENDTQQSPNIQHHVIQNIHSATVELAKSMSWPSKGGVSSTGTTSSHSPIVVVAPMDDYAAALLASSLAARIKCPLFFVEETWNDEVLRLIRQDLRPTDVIFVRGDTVNDAQVAGWMSQLSSLEGDGTSADGTYDPRAISIVGVTDAIEWLIAQDYTIDYLAVVNPDDRTAHDNCASRKLSLTAPMYTARRNGLVVTVSIDIPKNRRGGGKKEQEMIDRTLEVLRSAILAASPCRPDHVALVGGFDVIHTCQTKSENRKVFALSDIPYGQLEGNDCNAKRFRDIAIGRIYTESLSCGTLLAARTVNYELLVDKKWDTSIVEGGTWGFPEATGLFQVAGIDESPRHLFKKDMDKAQMVEAVAIFHKDHSSATNLGNFITSKTASLYSPAVVVTRGCHGAGIDEGSRHDGSVAGRMLGRGCVCYLGSPRSPTSANTLTEVAFLNELLYCSSSEQPMTVGQAMRSAFNKAMVNHLDGGPMNSYCLENEILLGDPALVPCFANGRASSTAGPSSCSTMVTPATSSWDGGSIVTVVGPSEWRRTSIHRGQLDEWKFQGDLFTYVAPCVEQETVWYGKGYDKQELDFVVTVVLPSGVTVNGVTALDAMKTKGGSSEVQACRPEWPTKWWPSGQHFVQHHSDGSTTVRWRLRLLDYDMPTGDIKAVLKSARFKLELS